MGVKGLWRVLQPVREEVSVTSLRGKVLAVDLAIWVVQSETVTNNELQGIYLRQMFYKINHLLEHGVGIIIVTDGRAPHLKALTIARRLGVELDRNSKVIQRRRFMKIMKECETLAQSLGITVLKGAFEAEAAAAKLQQDGLVDGVITTDGDAFLYGARQVYRNLLVTEKKCEVYKMSRVETELGLSRDDLVGLAILNGCDFNPDGISGLGRGTTLNYILSRDRGRTVTEELVEWSQQTGEIGEKYKQLENIKRKPHCGTCKHAGSKKEHTTRGCECCGTKSGCAPNNNNPCTCTKHVAQRLLSSPHMQCCVKFVKQNNVAAIPVRDIVTEFSNTKANETVYPRWELPPCFHFINFMEEKLQWRKCVSAQKFAHIAALHHLSQNISFARSYPVTAHTSLQFNHILKRRTRDKVDMFELEYTVLDYKLKSWLEFDVVYAVLDAKLVEDVMPDAVREFCGREVRLVRKKKETVPIYERYPVKKDIPDKKSKPVRPKTARKRRDEKRIEELSDSLSSLKIDGPMILSRDITSSVSTISPVPSSESSQREERRFSKAGDVMSRDVMSLPRDYHIRNDTGEGSSSEEEEYIPLSERLKLRRAKSAKPCSAISEKSNSEQAIISTSSLSSLDSKTASEGSVKPRDEYSEGYYIPDEIETETETDKAKSERESERENERESEMESERVALPREDSTLSGSEIDGYMDSDMQLLPHNFMDEYLDLSRDQILGISREETLAETESRDFETLAETESRDFETLAETESRDFETLAETGSRDFETLAEEAGSRDFETLAETGSRDYSVGIDTPDYQDRVGENDGFELKIPGDNGLNVHQDEMDISREASLLATESVDSESYKHLIEGGEYHNLFFATPRGKHDAVSDVMSRGMTSSPRDYHIRSDTVGTPVDSLRADESVTTASHLEISTMKLSQVSSEQSTLGDGDYTHPPMQSGGLTEVINISSDSEASIVGDAGDVQDSSFNVQAQNLEPLNDKDNGMGGEDNMATGVSAEEYSEVDQETSVVVEEVKCDSFNEDVSSACDSSENQDFPADNSVVLTETSTIANNEVTETSDQGQGQHEVAHVRQNKRGNNQNNLQDCLDTTEQSLSKEDLSIKQSLSKEDLRIRQSLSKGDLSIRQSLSKEDLSISLDLDDSELQDMSAGGFSPKTPARIKLNDLSNLSTDKLHTSSEGGHVTISTSKSTPLPGIMSSTPRSSSTPSVPSTPSTPAVLPDISSELVDSIIKLSVEEMSAEISDIEISDHVITDMQNLSISAEIPNKVVTLEVLPNKDSSLDLLPNKDLSLEMLPNKDASLESLPNKKISLQSLPNKGSSLETLPNKGSSLETLPNKDSSLGILPYKEISIEESLRSGESLRSNYSSFSSTQPDPQILVPDTPAPPEKLSVDLSRDPTNHVTPHMSNHVTPHVTSHVVNQDLSASTGAAVLGPIQSNNNSSFPAPQKLTFDVGDISDFEFSSLNLTEDNSHILTPLAQESRDISQESRDISPPQPGSPNLEIPNLLSQPHQPPDTSFFQPDIQISTPSWHRKPLSDITMATTRSADFTMSSTPKLSDKSDVMSRGVTSSPRDYHIRSDNVQGGGIARSNPLPDIEPERLEFQQYPDFNLNITKLLETTDVA